MTQEQRDSALQCEDEEYREIVLARFKCESPKAIDAMVRYANRIDRTVHHYGHLIYRFERDLDPQNGLGPHGRYWKKWLEELQAEYPQLPRMKMGFSSNPPCIMLTRE